MEYVGLSLAAGDRAHASGEEQEFGPQIAKLGGIERDRFGVLEAERVQVVDELPLEMGEAKASFRLHRIAVIVWLYQML
jgi:hypothetical protein